MIPAGACCRFVPSRNHRFRLQPKNLSCQALQFCNDPAYRLKRHIMAALAFHCFSKTIDIPAGLRRQPLEAWQPSARLHGLLRRSGIRLLGDLHGRKVVDFAWERNCGAKTLHELDSLARRAESGAEKASTPESAALPQNGAGFAIPESISQLQFHELPITARLANIVRSIGARTLGDLKGRSPFELLQYQNCGS